MSSVIPSKLTAKASERLFIHDSRSTVGEITFYFGQRLNHHRSPRGRPRGKFPFIIPRGCHSPHRGRTDKVISREMPYIMTVCY